VNGFLAWQKSVWLAPACRQMHAPLFFFDDHIHWESYMESTTVDRYDTWYEVRISNKIPKSHCWTDPILISSMAEAPSQHRSKRSREKAEQEEENENKRTRSSRSPMDGTTAADMDASTGNNEERTDAQSGANDGKDADVSTTTRPRWKGKSSCLKHTLQILLTSFCTPCVQLYPRFLVLDMFI